MKRAAAILILVAPLSACFPRPELSAYTEAFQAAHNAAEPIIADYAVAERATRLAVLQDPQSGRQYSGYFPTFDVGDSAAVSTVGLPPGAAAVERAFRGIGAYNNTLVMLAEGRNVDEAKGQLRQIIDDVGGIVPGSGSVVPIAGSVTDLIAEVFRPAVEADNKAQFKRIVLEGHPKVVALIALLRSHSEDQYATIIDPLLRRMRSNPADRDELIARINAWHRVFADYVMLLDAVEQRLNELKTAVDHPRSQGLLEQASVGAAELRSYSDALRRSVAAIRAAQ